MKKKKKHGNNNSFGGENKHIFEHLAAAVSFIVFNFLLLKHKQNKNNNKNNKIHTHLQTI